MIRTLFATALTLGAITGVAQAMPLTLLNAAANGDVIAVAGGCGPGLAPRPLWRLPQELRQPRRACLPARLPYRPRRRLPRQWQVGAEHSASPRSQGRGVRRHRASRHRHQQDQTFS
ncbi:hypothetical protein ACVW0J_002103 [Bradyrhizobium sp. i1.7.7]